MSNHLQHETSPYLLQHADNPVEWYPWCAEAFQKAKAEDKPIFLSIGYSTCHWCHVMAHESFEDKNIADILNRCFISIKVDKEERPDIDSIYMTVCQAFTGSGGWPTSIFMTPDQKPFFAGTYFDKNTFAEILLAVHDIWEKDKSSLLNQAEQITAQLRQQKPENAPAPEKLLESAVDIYKKSYDPVNGGFGRSPKFPAPHNLLFLLEYYVKHHDTPCLNMAEFTLQQMYRGGLFDHIGFGFCRYSTDKRFLIPHFEKMLYDNALLILAYCKAYSITQKALYLEIAEKTAFYILREMTAPEGGFYSAQDADSEGEEGRYYLFSPEEIISILGQDKGNAFNRRFNISSSGNFAGKNIPNLLNSDPEDKSLDCVVEELWKYRKKRYPLHTDDKILTSWNSLMIAAMCRLAQASGKDRYLTAAKKADEFIRKNLWEDDRLFVSFRQGQRGVPGFLDDYAAYILAQLTLYEVTGEQKYLKCAEDICQNAVSRFQDTEGGGFFLYGKDSEDLILRPKETYDGAIPSGNSLMAWNLVRLSQLVSRDKYESQALRQLSFLAADAAAYPPGHAMFLLALVLHQDKSPSLLEKYENQ